MTKTHYVVALIVLSTALLYFCACEKNVVLLTDDRILPAEEYCDDPRIDETEFVLIGKRRLTRYQGAVDECVEAGLIQISK